MMQPARLARVPVWSSGPLHQRAVSWTVAEYPLARPAARGGPGAMPPLAPCAARRLAHGSLNRASTCGRQSGHGAVPAARLDWETCAGAAQRSPEPPRCCRPPTPPCFSRCLQGQRGATARVRASPTPSPASAGAWQNTPAPDDVSLGGGSSEGRSSSSESSSSS